MIPSVQFPNKSATSGRYGSEPYDREAILGRLLLAAIHSELGEVDFFTREDLLHLNVFDHVTTITKYQRLCLAVRFLVKTGAIVSKSRTDLCLPGRAKVYPGGTGPLHEQFQKTVVGLALLMGREKLFSVGDVVSRWKNDPHLTFNVKRILVRRTLKELARRGELTIGENENEYLWENN